MAKSEVTVDVKAKLDVDRKTAEACLKLAEMYCNAHGAVIEGHRNDDGELSFEFVQPMHIDLPKITPETAEAIAALGEKVHRQRNRGV